MQLSNKKDFINVRKKQSNKMVNYQEFELTNFEDVFLGIDQSLTNTGLVVYSRKEQKVLAARCIRTEHMAKTHPIEVRINHIKNEIVKIIEEFNVKAICMEGPAFQASSNNGRILSGIFFLLLSTFCDKGIPYFIIPPTTLKKKATNYGHSDKEEMLNVIPRNELEYLMYLSGFKKIQKRFYDVVDAYHLALYFKEDYIQH